MGRVTKAVFSLLLAAFAWRRAFCHTDVSQVWRCAFVDEAQLSFPLAGRAAAVTAVFHVDGAT